MAYDITIGRDQADKKNFGERGLINIGKSYVKMGRYTSLSNRILMDVSRSHVVLVAGKRGSGKSYTLGVLAEELSNLPKEVSQNIGSLIFDTMGIYWTMKYKNEKDRELLQEWKLQPKNFPINILVPFGHYEDYSAKGIPLDKPFSLDASELEAEDWLITFGLGMTSPVSILIQRVLSSLKEEGRFTIEEIINGINKEERISQETKNSATGLFEAVKTWGVFATEEQEPTPIKDLISRGKTTVLDLSVYNSVGTFNIRALVISILCRKIFNQRMDARKKEEIQSVSRGLNLTSESEKKDYPLAWIFIDEVHEFLPLESKTVATDALIQLLREGRQPGISLVLATQQPGQIHRDVMTQSDIVISHRVTSKPDTEALNYIMQSYVIENIKKQMDDLPSLKGSAIVLDDNSERIYPIRVRPRLTWHGGEAPTAIKKEKKF